MTKKIKPLTIVWAVFASWLLLANPVQASETITHTLQSKALNQSRPVMIRLPQDYQENSSKHYPLLVTLNDEDNFNWASQAVEIQASRFGIEDMIVVGLPHTGNYSKDNYPFAKKGSLEPNPQAQNYSKFIRQEALPYVEKHYRTNGGRFIIGHSLSGLFVANLFIQHPQAFASYIVLSPSMHHAPQLADAFSVLFKQKPKLAGNIYLSIGDMEHQQIQQGYQKLLEVFEQAPASLNWHAVPMANTDHLLAAFKGTYDGLAWVYKDWYIQDAKMQQYSLADYTAHYQRLSAQLGYSIKPRKRHLVSFSGFARKRLDDPAAAKIALQVAAFYYPEDNEVKDKLLALADKL